MPDEENETLKCGSPGYVAPEIFSETGYGLKVDIYSCGIMLYSSLTGVSPFGGDTTEEIYENNKRGLIVYPGHLWKNVSKEAKNLVMCMTERDPHKRLSAEQVLMHPWFSVCETTISQNKLSIAIENMEKHNAE